MAGGVVWCGVVWCGVACALESLGSLAVRVKDGAGAEYTAQPPSHSPSHSPTNLHATTHPQVDEELGEADVVSARLAMSMWLAENTMPVLPWSCVGERPAPAFVRAWRLSLCARCAALFCCRAGRAAPRRYG